MSEKATESKSETITATGRRKTATARVRLFSNGSGNITVNGKGVEDYFYYESFLRSSLAPLAILEVQEQFDAKIKVAGSGPNGQAGAVSHGIARALEKFNPEWRSTLKKAGYLKRDPRGKERKKPGQPGARKRFQFSKR